MLLTLLHNTGVLDKPVCVEDSMVRGLAQQQVASLWHGILGLHDAHKAPSRLINACKVDTSAHLADPARVPTCSQRFVLADRAPRQ